MRVFSVILVLFIFLGCGQIKPEAPVTLEDKDEEVTVVSAEDAAPVTIVAAEKNINPQAMPEAIGKAFSDKDVQLALKNAGLYEGVIDGKIGPKTRKAIELFQEKNNLKVDGKVGANTWSKLKSYLTPIEKIVDKS